MHKRRGIRLKSYEGDQFPPKTLLHRHQGERESHANTSSKRYHPVPSRHWAIKAPGMLPITVVLYQQMVHTHGGQARGFLQYGTRFLPAKYPQYDLAQCGRSAGDGRQFWVPGAQREKGTVSQLFSETRKLFGASHVYGGSLTILSVRFNARTLNKFYLYESIKKCFVLSIWGGHTRARAHACEGII